MLRSIFSFPHPVNEIAARLVAGMVAIPTALIILFDAYYLCFLLSYGFCFGCFVFGLLMNTGLVPQEVCEGCANWQIIATKENVSS